MPTQPRRAQRPSAQTRPGPALRAIEHQDVRCPICRATVVAIPGAAEAEPPPALPCPHTALILVSAAGGEPEMIRPEVERWWRSARRAGAALGSGDGQVEPGDQRAFRYCPQLAHLVEMRQQVGPATVWLVSVGFAAAT